MKNSNNTIVYFHIGRGGRFNNAGHRSFCGTKNIEEVLSLADNSGNWNFIVFENESKIRETLEERNLSNLLELFEKDIEVFAEKTKVDLGEKIYVNINGKELISVEEAETGVGRLDWDGCYNSDVCFYLSECDEDDLQTILDSQEWNKEDVIKEYFDDCTNIECDWSKFNGDFEELITAYFNFPNIDITDFYKDEE